jgi:hypothetical protein
MEDAVTAERREDMLTESRKTQSEVCKVLSLLRGGRRSQKKETT